MPGSFANGGAEAIRRLWKQRVVDRRAVAAGVDGVHDREGAAYAKGKAEKEADDGGPGETHAAVKFTRMPVSLYRAGQGGTVSGWLGEREPLLRQLVWRRS